MFNVFSGSEYNYDPNLKGLRKLYLFGGFCTTVIILIVLKIAF